MQRSVAILSNRITSAVEAGGFGSGVVSPLRSHVGFRHVARGPRGIEPGAGHCPFMALIAVCGLPFLALPFFRIDEDFIAAM